MSQWGLRTHAQDYAFSLEDSVFPLTEASCKTNEIIDVTRDYNYLAFI